MVLLNTHNICFGREIRTFIFIYALLSKGMCEWKLKLQVRIYICDYSVCIRTPCARILPDVYTFDCIYMLNVLNIFLEFKVKGLFKTYII